MTKCKGVVTVAGTGVEAPADFKTAFASEVGYLVERMARSKKRKKLDGFDEIALTRSIGADQQRNGALIVQFRFGEVLKVSEEKHVKSRLGRRVRDGWHRGKWEEPP